MNALNASRRPAASKFVHELCFRDEVVAERRSEHAYDYALVRLWYNHEAERREVVEVKWSRKPRSPRSEWVSVPVAAAEVV